MDSRLGRLRIQLLLPVFVFFLCCAFHATALAAGSGKIQILTSKGAVTFKVQYAITPEEKAKGLMFKESLPNKSGMLFIYQTPKEVNMWMKNTLMSLDIFFITRKGRIRTIQEKAEPGSTRLIPSGGKVVAVLEMIAGTAESYGIKVGDQVNLLN